jgi:hypothetical protein
MTAKDELEEQRSCRFGLTGGEMAKTNRTRLTRVALRRFCKESGVTMRRQVNLARARVSATDEPRKTCAGLKQAVPIWLDR